MSDSAEKNKWYKYPDVKPEKYDTYLIYTDGGIITMAFYNLGDVWDFDEGGEVLYWMFLPDSPIQ